MKTRYTTPVLIAAAFAAAIVLLGATPAGATGVSGTPPVIPTISETPGATLLLPYFEVDLAHPTGRTTRFWINNATATAVLVHVTIWSDLAVPVLAFNEYLTGYDVQPIDMRDIFNGKLPATASAGQDPTDTISPKGQFSQDINFASCYGQLPLTVMPQIYVAYIQAALTGQFSSFNGACSATVSPGLARGFVTIDTVNNCTLRLPGQPGYFGPGGSGDATNQNVLWGEYQYINSDTNGQAGNGAPLVEIEADASNTLTNTANNYTFYGRLDGPAWSAVDNREPLATNFAGRYVKNATYAVVWRDPKVAQQPFACGTLPPWFPLGREGLELFDEQEHVTTRVQSLESPAGIGLAFPAATQKVLVGSGPLPTPYASGWMFFNLNTHVGPAGDVPSSDKNAAQGFVTMIREINGGTFGNVGAEGGPAFRLDSAAAANHSNP
ncbi:MAG TPA: hypothetical protein VFS34_06090 [Thermoanaerobaculia bacterium]|nr:hypothetical protein [Thermoanaerobaculia bacterium]